HLWTARNAARLCGEPEPQPPPIEPNVAHRSLAMTAIIFSAAFPEALVNEVILDVIEPPQGKPSARVEGIPISTATIPFKQLWRNERKLKPLGKYQATLKAVNEKPYKRGLEAGRTGQPHNGVVPPRTGQERKAVVRATQALHAFQTGDA
ncbi:hypothetical protein, partial [Mycobacterium sp.]